MALYQNPFGACASCDALLPASADQGPVPVPGPSATDISITSAGPAPLECEGRSRWIIWLVIGLGLGYLANE